MSTPSEPALLRVHDLHKSYGDLEVLKGINLELKAGETLSLIGPSGSVAYTVQSGTLKNLNLKWRNSTMRRDYSNNEFDENRVIVSYPISLL